MTILNKVKYVASEIEKNGADPYWWRQRFISRVIGPSLGYIHGTTHGENYMEKDWDNLFLLDACRADMFEETFDLSQFSDYTTVHSNGTSSPEWMRNTFDGQEYPDTVYVTANPWIAKVEPGAFHDVVNLWVEHYDVNQEDFEGQDVLADVGLEDVPTIYPDTVNKAAKSAYDQYPNKRLLIHYFQPHAPVVGNPDGSRRDTIQEDCHPGETLKDGDISRYEVWKAYKDNLKYVFYWADKLAKNLGGKTVFSSDHGELFGEWLWPFPIRGYAHPSSVRHPNLTEVPWAIEINGDRRKITTDGTTQSTIRPDEEELDDQLQALGYKV